MKNTKMPFSDSPGASPLRDNRMIGLSYVGGGVAWLLHLLLAYLVAEFGCIRGWGEIRLLGITLVAWLILLVSAVTFAGAVGATVLARAIEGGRREGAAPVGEGDETAAGFAARTAFATNLTFAFVILVETIPIFYYLHDC